MGWASQGWRASSGGESSGGNPGCFHTSVIFKRMLFLYTPIADFSKIFSVATPVGLSVV